MNKGRVNDKDNNDITNDKGNISSETSSLMSSSKESDEIVQVVSFHIYAYVLVIHT